LKKRTKKLLILGLPSISAPVNSGTLIIDQGSAPGRPEQ
jgi:hypothetical protein